MYFGEYVRSKSINSRIVRAVMDGTQMVTIISEGTIISPTGLALDRTGDAIAFIYFMLLNCFGFRGT